MPVAAPTSLLAVLAALVLAPQAAHAAAPSPTTPPASTPASAPVATPSPASTARATTPAPTTPGRTTPAATTPAAAPPAARSAAPATSVTPASLGAVRPARPATRRPDRVALRPTLVSVAPSTVVSTDPAVPVTGTLSPAEAGRAVTVQRLVGGAWSPVASTVTDDAGRFAAAVAVGADTVGASALRVTRTDAAGYALTGPVMTVQRVLPADDVRLTDAQARGVLASAGVGVFSSGGCSDRTSPVCTSFDTIRTATVRAVVDTKVASGCDVTVSGGTEAGHASGTYSHASGYKADLLMTTCLRSFVTRTADPVGGPYWYRAPVRYFDEVNHWDLTVR